MESGVGHVQRLMVIAELDAVGAEWGRKTHPRPEQRREIAPLRHLTSAAGGRRLPDNALEESEY